MTPGAFRLFLAALVAFSHTAGPAVGRPAVYLFFILSGYWITRMWQERYAQTKASYLTFVISRAWRLLPVYWLCLIITLLICWVTARHSAEEWELMSRHWWIFKTTILLGSGLDFHALISAWSLDYEFQFYLLAPLILWCPPVLTGSRLSTAWCLCLGLIAWYMTGIHPLPKWVFQFMGFFGLGMLAHLAKWRPERKWVHFSLWLGALSLIALCAGYLACVVSPGKFEPWFKGSLDWRDALVALIGAPAALDSCLRPSLTLDRALGAASYPLYLAQDFTDIFFEQMLRDHGMALKIFSLPVQWVTMLMISAVLYWWVDRPVDAWRHAWVKGRLRTADASRPTR